MQSLSQVAENETSVRWTAVDGDSIALTLADPGEEENFIVAMLTPDMMRSVALWWASVDPGDG